MFTVATLRPHGMCLSGTRIASYNVKAKLVHGLEFYKLALLVN